MVIDYLLAYLLSLIGIMLLALAMRKTATDYWPYRDVPPYRHGIRFIGFSFLLASLIVIVFGLGISIGIWVWILVASLNSFLIAILKC